MCDGILVSICMDRFFFFFKQKTAYEMRISDWSSDVCSSDLGVLSNTGQVCISGSRLIVERSVADELVERVATLMRQTVVGDQIGRASCRERVCQYVYISVVHVSLTKKRCVTSAVDKTLLKLRGNDVYTSDDR